MKSIFTPILLLTAILVLAQSAKKPHLGVDLNPNYSKAAKLDSILKSFAPNILPGATIALYSEKEGWWATSAGYADVKNKTPMRNDHLQYLQSVSKMHMAVAILQLREQGKIDLDQPMTKYLPKQYSRYITDADQITVRMLLNHTSGIPEYNENPEFLSEVLLHPLKNFTAEEALSGIENLPLQWKPGSKYRYVNTNYMLLALIGDAVTGDHAQYIREHIFKPLGLQNSHYGNGSDYLKGLHLPRSYWDVFNAGLPIDVTPFQQMTVVCSKGDDGIVSTPVDAVLFLKALFEGRLLKPESFNEMMRFVKDEKGRDRYGMGMIAFDINGTPAYGHGGGGVGAGCGLVYIPSRKVYAFYAINLAVFPNGELPNKAGEMKNAIEQVLMK
ncbi:serine hydrolase domain-containing protein [Flavobacterium sp.]|uniref:serine hydrolase domain-containing protein n=1 Tax=Flavobacterium sp. TaxID=239 RepID=UPI0039E2408E